MYRSAYELYQSEIINGDKLYDRYVNDFISFHLPIFTSDELLIREHIMHISGMHELLTERTDLVKMYFTKNSFTFADYESMNKEFNTISFIHQQPKRIANFNKKTN